MKNAALITPKENVLLGITRKVILEIAKQNKIKTEERKVKLSEIQIADEAFITGSSKGIVPVVQIDGKWIGNGKVGKTTQKLKILFENHAIAGNNIR